MEQIGIWLNNTVLKLNKYNTEFIVFSSKQHVKKIENVHTEVYKFFHVCKKSRDYN